MVACQSIRFYDISGRKSDQPAVDVGPQRDGFKLEQTSNAKLLHPAVTCGSFDRLASLLFQGLSDDQVEKSATADSVG